MQTRNGGFIGKYLCRIIRDQAGSEDVGRWK